MKPNPLLELTRTGVALGLLPGLVHHPSSGPSATPALAPQLNRRHQKPLSATVATSKTRESGSMKPRTKLRLLGGAVLLFNLWLIGHYSIEGIPVLLMTFGFAIAYEYVVVRRAPE